MKVSAVIPTKDRAALLAETVRTLLAQTVAPEELIVVDQSATDEGRRAVSALVQAVPIARRPGLVYVWDRAINGAAAARNAGLDLAHGEIVVFCDDDVAPEAVVVERLVGHYARVPDLAGLAPVIVNYPRPGWLSRAAHVLFRLGPFRDERQPVYWNWRRYPEVVEGLVKASVKDTTVSVRVASIQSLAKMGAGSPEVVETMEKLKTDHDAKVREAAGAALAKLRVQ